ncbi:potassium channel family protein [Acaryochloris sp. IP29b_bin.148]|uniref:potassium channel family protein n=1 Tax=Acaryochloris sp. IP29b_bin.148 TaxID=2969218 RepID=UPI002603A62F|nr:potassium channel family protein [Acaryochloris sp. IP29b_bin.148]
MKRPEQPRSHKYRQLLFVLILVFSVSPFLQSGIGRIVTTLLLLYTIMVIIYSFTLPKLQLYLYIVIAVMAACLEVCASLGWIPRLNQTFAVISQVIFAAYLSGAAYWIGRDIFRTPKVTLDTVRGGISVYMLIGFVWALLYGIVSTLDPYAFSKPLVQQHSFLKALHFSFTTLTTLGYGDIVPVSEIALILTNLEAIIGQMYVTVFIAIVVGGYLLQQR